MPASGSDQCCWLCPCNRGDNPFNEFRARTPGHWTNHARDYRMGHPAFEIWGATLHVLAIDVMHT
eukprot:7306554-Pyramimonas_sp.AAC.1